ncbi:sulfotransferase family protein [Sediminihabitans luteus]|uniref:Sulfotransferase family protein n=1 Tax=Sediminihabitans luteus TaxID=1138585 RepID=A0A2M9CE63_9CELL|nr:sulfotransferase [Sediminihabitans luteus]PJJ70168.1 sulfotransferase family protein [Sediminihabitans luteus]GII97639.1 hypothetical protein Slu03_00170 [Sediminihabitans luteus]
MALIIAGFHRSGTSALAQMLHTAGLFVGDRLLGAMPSNPYGHFEDRDFLDLHRQILGAHGGDWQWVEPHPFHVAPDHWRAMRALARKREIHHERWGFKDPRACFFLGHWKYLLPDAKTVAIYRDPADCVRSMEVRHARAILTAEGNAAAHRRFFEEPDHGLRLWATYNRRLVSFVEAHLEDCLVIPFSALGRGAPVVEMVNERLGTGLVPQAGAGTFDAAATSQRDAPQRVFDGAVADEVREVWSALESLAARTSPTETRSLHA